MKKLHKTEVSVISKGLRRRNLELSEYCAECLHETDISELNLATGVCTRCHKNIKKLSKEEIDKLIGLYND
jgi:uncharacterized protein with PIN domain